MMILQIDPERCEICDSCPLQEGCLGQVVKRPERGAPPTIDEERCYGCGMCVMICPHDAVIEK